MLTVKVEKSFCALEGFISGEKSVYLVYDSNVRSYASQVMTCCPQIKDSLAIETSEDLKNISTVVDICSWLLNLNADRNALVLALGGGITTDMVGFAACIYKRGVRYANLPTTLLAMVDAAIGGKTGVNLEAYKNILGVIRQPEFTYICTETLATLPQRQFLTGAAELLKTFIIKNENGNYAKAVEAVRTKDLAALLPLIGAAANVKAAIVEEDEFEGGLRRVLNLGHTYAHAIEWYQHANPCNDPFTHGEAVSVGLVMAARISEQRGCCAQGLASQIASDLRSCGLPTELPCPEEQLLGAIKKDKKAEGGKVNFVLINSIGNVSVELI